MSTYASATTRSVALHDIPELDNPNFLNILLPVTQKVAKQPETQIPAPMNPLIDALKSTARRTLTANGAPAYSSTDSPTLNAFITLSRYTDYTTVSDLLAASWAEDEELTLRIIWNLRSIHDGKGEKEAFYMCWGWLYEHHPRTAIENLHKLVEPVSDVRMGKGKGLASHGYWKDLLNILALATVGQLDSATSSTFLHCPRTPRKQPRWSRTPKKKVKEGTKEERIQNHLLALAREKEEAHKARQDKYDTSAAQLRSRLSTTPKFKALLIAVARAFATQLLDDVKVLEQVSALPENAKRQKKLLLKKISLAAKWAPTPGCSHDRATNISTMIAQLVYASQSLNSYPSALSEPTLSSVDRAHILRSYYQRWILTELRRATHLPEPLMSANRWGEIDYGRVSSVCMKNNSEHFARHDPEGFEAYLVKVEEGKAGMSGRTLMPHELVARVVAGERSGKEGGKMQKLEEVRRKMAEMQSRVVEAQWKTLVENLRSAGTIENAIAVCDVSGSMGSLYHSYSTRGSKGNDTVAPILPAVSLSLILASIASPPFNGGFITFSHRPQYQTVDPTSPLAKQVRTLATADWGMNTDLTSVFLDLILPLAKKHKVKKEEMIKRVFVFSDMQFDQGYTCPASAGKRDEGGWETNYEVIKRAYEEVGYDVPQVVYWDLATGGGRTTKETDEKEKAGVAMMNGFSSAMMKVFMGEVEGEEASDSDAKEGEEEWEEVEASKDGDGESVTVVGEKAKSAEKKKRKDEFTPVAIMKKALMKTCFDGLVIVD